MFGSGRQFNLFEVEVVFSQYMLTLAMKQSLSSNASSLRLMPLTLKRCSCGVSAFSLAGDAGS